MKSVSNVSTNAATHIVRIIGGTWRRTRLPVPDRPGLRPTPNRVRETLFNWLGQDLSGWRCIDAFAGTGALGLEAASRGASWVTLVECEAKLVAQLRTTVARLNATSVQVLHADAVKTLSAQPTASLDLVLLDPPFDSQLYIPALTAAAPTLRLGGWLYLEAPNAWSDSDCQALGLTLHRYLKAGAVHAHLLIKKE